MSTERARREWPDLGQRQLATRGQLLEHGWTPSAIEHAVGRRIRMVHRGVYAGHLGPLDEETRLLAGSLWAAPGRAVLTGMAALRQWGVDDVGSVRRHIFLVPSTGRDRSTQAVRAVRTRRLPVGAMESSSGVPVASAARAVVDAARLENVGGNTLRAVVLKVLQRDLSRVESLRHEIDRAPAHRLLSAAEDAVEEFENGAWSLPEAALATLVRSEPLLASMLFNPVLEMGGVVLGTPDGYVPEVGLVVQVHSRRFHDKDASGGDLWAGTVERDNRYTGAGLTVVGLAPTTIDRRPREALAQIVRACANAAPRSLDHITVRAHRS